MLPRRKPTSAIRASPALLQSFGRIYMNPAEAIDLYTKQCSLNVCAKDLAVMGATLADGGVNPLTKERVVDADGLPLRAGGHGDRGVVRDLGRLAVRHRPAGQERDRRRDRHRLSREGRPWELLPRRSTRPATASKGSSSPSSCPNGWAWICSSRSPKFERPARTKSGCVPQMNLTTEHDLQSEA